MPSIRELEVQASAVRLFTRVAGDLGSGNVLIAINGGPGLSSNYMLDLERLAGSDLAVATYDQRGVRRSSSPSLDPANFTIQKYVEDLDAVRSALGVEKVYLLGHSWGGIVAMSYAMAYPERVRSIVFVNSGPPTWTEIMAAQQRLGVRIQALQQNGIIPKELPSDKEQQMPLILRAYFADPNFWFSPEQGEAPTYSETVSALTMTAMNGFDLTAKMAELNLPALILVGDADPFGLPMAESIRNALPRAKVEFVVLPTCGHFWHECPDPFYARVRPFLGLRSAQMESENTLVRRLDGTSVPTAELQAFIEQTMEKANVAGLTCAIINDGQVVYRKAFGVRNASIGARNDEETVFDAASFSKPVFAYLVMLLAEEGVINLDKLLYEYLTKPLYEYPAYADLKSDERYKQITARMVLSHSTGFPNLRFLEPDGRLKFLFSPGERHSYSGEGINLLQIIIEEVTGKDLETLAQEKIFRPLRMTHSSYNWKAECEGSAASPHDEFGRPRGWSDRTNKPGAGGSMVTTAGDYARFISHGILNVEGKRRATIDEMLRPQIAINYKNMFGPGAWQATDQYRDMHLAWGLGWGRFDTPYGGAFFHTGHGFGWQNYTVTYIDKGIGIVLLSNSDNFESVAQEIVEKAIGDVYTPFGWLGYVPFDPSKPKTAPPPDPVIIKVDPAILMTYAGTYDMQPTARFQIKFEDGQLWILSMDGKRWVPLCAETETHFFVKGVEAYHFEFIRDTAGKVIALRLEIQGIPFPPAPKMEPR